MPLFEINFYSSQVFWLSNVFGLFYLCLSRIIIPRIKHSIISRTNLTDIDEEKTKELNKKSEELEKFKKQQMLKLQEEISDIKQQALRQLEKTFNEKKAEVVSNLKFKTKKVEDQMKVYNKKFHDLEIEPCVNVAAAVIEKITGKTLDIELINKIAEKNKL